MATHQLNKDGRALLALLANRLLTADPENPRTFVTYSGALRDLRIDDVLKNSGRTLQGQGLNSLAEWAKESGVPAITGFIVRETDHTPGEGYFKLYGKRYPDDVSWWLGEIKQSKQFDWSRFLDQENYPSAGPDLLAEARRIANLIGTRVSVSGETLQRTAPERTAPEDLVSNIHTLLQASPLVCYLCGGTMQIKARNRLLQPSPDRVDSRIGDYGPENLRLAHLACNLGKNAASLQDFGEWLSLLRNT